jgi:septal ring factor EnvC (AmiA/AmiB activator)
MRKIKVVCFVLFLFILAQPILAKDDSAQLENRLKEYINEISIMIKSTEDPAQKRDILDTTLKKIIEAMETAEGLTSLSAEDRAALATLKKNFQDKHDELNGLNGFERVADEDLNDFTDYVLQDLEQARNMLTMSLAAFIIIILLIIIIV